MIEYLNAIAAVLLLLAAVLSLLKTTERLDSQRITDGIESLKNILEFISNVPQWIHFYHNLNANVHKLRDKRNKLQKRLKDMTDRVVDEEFKTARQRKREVDNWLTTAGAKCTEVQTLLQGMARESNHFWKFIYRAWLGNRVEISIQEVDDLLNAGVFEEVLSSVREIPEYVTAPLVGNAAAENNKRIMTWLANGVTRIGVHGIKGVGKTAFMKHIHNQLLKNYDHVHVYFISVLENYEEYHLQGAIARELGIMELHEEDEHKRAAVLYRALQKRNFVLILDGLTKYISDDKVGIPLGAETGKMIITSRSPDVCRKTGCQNNILAMDPLPFEEAWILFKEKVQLTFVPGSSMENIAMKIVEQCKGVPLKIVDKARELIGQDDINVWKNTLNGMLEDNAC